ncbi:hypothetical protein NX059_000996 [Plenodomus lindquistii]|nr:hypothetical protein NX059_000996 [Plenodomus lindquistii]
MQERQAFEQARLDDQAQSLSEAEALQQRERQETIVLQQQLAEKTLEVAWYKQLQQAGMQTPQPNPQNVLGRNNVSSLTPEQKDTQHESTSKRQRINSTGASKTWIRSAMPGHAISPSHRRNLMNIPQSQKLSPTIVQTPLSQRIPRQSTSQTLQHARPSSSSSKLTQSLHQAQQTGQIGQRAQQEQMDDTQRRLLQQHRMNLQHPQVSSQQLVTPQRPPRQPQWTQHQLVNAQRQQRAQQMSLQIPMNQPIQRQSSGTMGRQDISQMSYEQSQAALFQRDQRARLDNMSYEQPAQEHVQQQDVRASGQDSIKTQPMINALTTPATAAQCLTPQDRLQPSLKNLNLQSPASQLAAQQRIQRGTETKQGDMSLILRFDNLQDLLLSNSSTDPKPLRHTGHFESVKTRPTPEATCFSPDMSHLLQSKATRPFTTHFSPATLHASQKNCGSQDIGVYPDDSHPEWFIMQGADALKSTDFQGDDLASFDVEAAHTNHPTAAQTVIPDPATNILGC